MTTNEPVKSGNGPERKNRVLLSSGSLSGFGLDGVLAAAAATGFDGVELIVDEHEETVRPTVIRELCRRRGIPIPVVHSPFDFLNPPGWEKDETARVKRSVALAEEIGADSVVLHTPYYADREFRRWLEEDLLSFQETTRIVLLVENMPCYRKPFGRLGRFLGAPDLLERDRKGPWRLVPDSLLPRCFPLSEPERMARFPHIVLDTTHLGTGGLDPAEVFTRLGDRVKHIHLSNFDGREHLELRSGFLDLAGFLRRTAAESYSGGYCLELISERFPSREKEAVLALLRDNLAFIHAHARIEHRA